MPGGKVGQAAGEQAVGTGQARRQAGRGPPAGQLQVGHGAVHLLEDALGALQEPLPPLVEQEPLARPVEQGGAQLLLQAGDALGQGGLAQVQQPGGPGQALGLGGGGEIAQLGQGHDARSSLRPGGA